MAFVHSKDSRVLVNDASLSADIKGWTVSHKRDTSDVTAIADSGFRGLPGLMEGSMQLEANFNSSADRVNDVVKTTIGVDNDLLVTVWPEGGAVGKPAMFAMCDTESYEVESSVKDAVSLNVEGAAHAMVDMGVSLHDLTAETATGNGASVDNAALTSNGGAAQLHVTAASGTTPNLTVKVQHSTDDSVWVDLITFSAATTQTYQNSEVAAGTTVNRYTRSTRTISGTTPSFTYGVSFARR